MMRVGRRAALREVDAPPIEQGTVAGDRDEHYGIAVLDNSDAGKATAARLRHRSVLHHPSGVVNQEPKT